MTSGNRPYNPRGQVAGVTDALGESPRPFSLIRGTVISSPPMASCTAPLTNSFSPDAMVGRRT